MFSKTRTRLLACFTTGLVITGCIGKVGEDAPPPTAQKFSGAQCLSTAKPVVKAFLEGSATDMQVGATFDCINSALDSFRRYVRGRTSDRYTPQEVATFLEDNFLNLAEGERLSADLQSQLMKIKQLLVGGSDQFITLDELTKARTVISDLRGATVSLNPYMKMITLNWQASEAHNFSDGMKYFEEGNVQLQNMAKVLAQIIESNGRAYLLSDFVSFMDHLSDFMGGIELRDSVEKYMPVVRKVKQAIAGGEENVIEPHEWRRFALLGARGYIQYLRYHYFIASSSESGNGYRVAYMARTVEDILSIFADLVGEKPGGIVTRGEVYGILETLSQVWPDFKVSEEMVMQLMKIKQTLFGGSVNYWNTADFIRARSKVDRLRVVVETFLPFSEIYGQDWDIEGLDPVQAKEFFFDSQAALGKIGKDVSELLEDGYDLTDVDVFMAELQRLYPGGDGAELATTVRKFIPLIVDAKNVFLGSDNGPRIEKDQWGRVLNIGTKVYSDFLFSYYFLREQTWDNGETLKDVSYFVNQTLDILKEILLQKESQVISKPELLQLLNHFSKLDILPATLKKGALENLVDLILNNVLFPYELRLKGQKINALTLTSVEVAREEVQIWIEAEIYLMEVAKNQTTSASVGASDLLAKLKALKADTAASSQLRTAASELLITLSGAVPMTVDAESRLFISVKHPQSYDVLSLRKANLNRALARVIIRSLAMDTSRIKNYKGLNLAELQAGFDKLAPLVVEMGLLDPANKGFASSRFREANIFTPQGDGNDLASLGEVADLAGMIFSGLTVNDMLYQGLMKDCFGGAQKVPSTSVVKIDCVKKSYRASMPSLLSSMPDYLKYMSRASSSEWSTYMTNVFKTAGYIANSKQEAKLRDISLTPHVIQYIEMVFARYDKDRNGLITTDEALKAYPSFRGILVELADGAVDEEDLPAVFTYILYYGKPPETMMEKLRFALFWRGQPEKWNVKAGRSMMAQILGYIADQVNKNARVSMKGIPTEAEAKSRAKDVQPIDPDYENQYRN